MDVKSGRFMYQSGRAGDEAKKRKSPAKSGRVSISVIIHALCIGNLCQPIRSTTQIIKITSSVWYFCSHCLDIAFVERPVEAPQHNVCLYRLERGSQTFFRGEGQGRSLIMGVGKKNSKFLISRGLQLSKALFLRPRKTAGCI